MASSNHKKTANIAIDSRRIAEFVGKIEYQREKIAALQESLVKKDSELFAMEKHYKKEINKIKTMKSSHSNQNERLALDISMSEKEPIIKNLHDIITDDVQWDDAEQVLNLPKLKKMKLADEDLIRLVKCIMLRGVLVTKCQWQKWIILSSIHILETGTTPVISLDDIMLFLDQAEKNNTSQNINLNEPPNEILSNKNDIDESCKSKIHGNLKQCSNNMSQSCSKATEKKISPNRASVKKQTLEEYRKTRKVNSHHMPREINSNSEYFTKSTKDLSNKRNNSLSPNFSSFPQVNINKDHKTKNAPTQDFQIQNNGSYCILKTGIVSEKNSEVPYNTNIQNDLNSTIDGLKNIMSCQRKDNNNETVTNTIKNIDSGSDYSSNLRLLKESRKMINDDEAPVTKVETENEKTWKLTELKNCKKKVEYEEPEKDLFHGHILIKRKSNILPIVIPLDPIDPSYFNNCWTDPRLHT